MQAPEGLSEAGIEAWNRAVRATDGAEDQDRLYDLAARYANAVDVAERARKEWHEAGRPMTFTQPNGAEAPHPLLKVMNEHDKLAHRFGAALKIEAPSKSKHRGPAPSAVVQPEPSPAARLRAVS